MIKTTNSTRYFVRVGAFVCMCDIGSGCFLNYRVPKGVLFGEEGSSHCSLALSVLGTCICLSLVWEHISWLIELSAYSLGVPAWGWGRSCTRCSPCPPHPWQCLGTLCSDCPWVVSGTHLAWSLLLVGGGLWLSPPGWLVSCSSFKAVFLWPGTLIILNLSHPQMQHF